MAENASHARDCPACKLALPDTAGYRAWCPGCEWNIEPEKTSRIVFRDRRNRLDKALRRFADRFSKAQFDRLIASGEPVFRPTLTTSKLLAYGLVALVGLAYLSVLVVGVFLVWPLRWPMTAIGLFLIGLFVVARPRLGKVETRWLVNRSEAPALFGLIERISASLGCKAPDHVAIDSAFNASFGEVGLRRHSILTLGLPLWSILSGEERVALIAHELGHGVNADPMRGLVLFSGVSVLYRWMTILWPDHLIGRQRNILVAVCDTPFRLALLGVAKGLDLIARLLLALIWHESQRAEYFAHAVSGRVAGTKAAACLLDRLAFAACIPVVTQRIAYQVGPESDFFEDYPRYIAELPVLEVERLKRLNLREKDSFDSSHPPNIYRKRMLELFPATADVVLTEAESREIDAELQALRPERQDSLIASYHPDL